MFDYQTSKHAHFDAACASSSAEKIEVNFSFFHFEGSARI